MADQNPYHIFLSYSHENQDLVESLARRLQGDARLSFWFGPWHSIPSAPIQEQMEDALWDAQACAVFISGQLEGWQNEQMRVAIQTHVEDEPGYRVIPVLAPGATRPSRRELPRFLRRCEMVAFQSPDDESAFKRLLAGILDITPIKSRVISRRKRGRNTCRHHPRVSLSAVTPCSSASPTTPRSALCPKRRSRTPATCTTAMEGDFPVELVKRDA